MTCERSWLLSAAAIAMLVGRAAMAQETTTYTYDGLGRLKASVIAGGPNNNIQTATCLDAAGNRTQYLVAAEAPPACGSGGGDNRSPVAVNDSVSLNACSSTFVDLLSNDYDPSNSVPLDLVSIAIVSGAGRATASVSGSTTVEVITTKTAGTTVFQYVMRNSLGATGTGQLSVTNRGGTAPCTE